MQAGENSRCLAWGCLAYSRFGVHRHSFGHPGSHSMAAAGSADDGCGALVRRILWETLLDHTGCGGYGKAFGDLHPYITDMDGAVAHACGVLRAFVAEAAGSAESGELETALLEALPFFTDEHKEAVRAWLSARARRELGSSAPGSPRHRRPRAARQWAAGVVAPEPRPAATKGEEVEKAACDGALHPTADTITGAVESRLLGSGSLRPGESVLCAPVCMASAWAYYMDASGTLLRSDENGAIRWRALGGAEVHGATWERCPDRYAFQCAESYHSEVTGRRHQLHRVEVYSPLSELRAELAPGAGQRLWTGSAEVAVSHRTLVGVELAMPFPAAAPCPAIGVFCRARSSSRRVCLECTPIAERDVLRFLFPPDLVLSPPEDGLVVELARGAGAELARGAGVASLVTQEILLLLERA
jgi:hypothetical protein